MVCSVVVLTYVEVESICTGAAIDVSIVVGVGAALVVVDIMPCVSLASILVIRVVCCVWSNGYVPDDVYVVPFHVYSSQAVMW